MNAHTATSSGSTTGSSSTWPVTDVSSTVAIPPSRISASTGSWSAAAARSESSRSAAKTGRGEISTASARFHQSRSSACVSAAFAPALTALSLLGSPPAEA